MRIFQKVRNVWFKKVKKRPQIALGGSFSRKWVESRKELDAFVELDPVAEITEVGTKEVLPDTPQPEPQPQPQPQPEPQPERNHSQSQNRFRTQSVLMSQKDQ